MALPLAGCSLAIWQSRLRFSDQITVCLSKRKRKSGLKRTLGAIAALCTECGPDARSCSNSSAQLQLTAAKLPLAVLAVVPAVPVRIVLCVVAWWLVVLLSRCPASCVPLALEASKDLLS